MPCCRGQDRPAVPRFLHEFRAHNEFYYSALPRRTLTPPAVSRREKAAVDQGPTCLQDHLKPLAEY